MNLQRFFSLNLLQQQKLKQLLITIATIGVISVFGIKIFESLDRGIQAQKRTESIASEISALEKQNNQLQYEKELFSNQDQREAEYRALENKQKTGEKIYIIARDSKENSPETTPSNMPEVNSNGMKNYFNDWIQLFTH